jgi:sugar (pentulose or hexulose) kinase
LAWEEIEEAAMNAPPFRSFIDPSVSAFQVPADMCAAIASYCAESKQPIPQNASEIARCVFESLSFAYREVLEEIERVTGRLLSAIRVVGGGCLNQFLCQMTADATGREVIAGPVEAAALGNAMVQAVATGHIKNLTEGRAALRQSIELRSYEPAHADDWRQAFERYRSLVARKRNLETAPT